MSVKQWLEDRLGLRLIRRGAIDRRVPKTPWYYGDGATLLLLFGVLVLTGPLLALSYNPSPEHAHESIRYINEQMLFGSFIRALHYWTAGAMVVMLFFHLLRVILVGGYKAPREGTWLFGVALFFLVLIMSFTGYLLRWDQRAITGIQLVLAMFDYVPFIGDGLVRFVMGQDAIGALTLTRLFGVHAIFVPLLLFGAVAAHFFLVIVNGVTSPAERLQPVATAEEQRALYKQAKNSPATGEPFYPDAAVKSGAMGLIVFSVPLLLAVFARPAPLGPRADLTAAAPFPAEEWWWSWYSALAALLPPSIAPAFYVGFPIALFVVLVALPFVDRRPERGIRKRPVAVGVVVVCALALVGLTALRQLSPWTGWPSETPPALPAGKVLTERAEEGRRLFAEYGCNGCHAVAGDGRRVGSDMTNLTRLMSYDELREFILDPPDDIAMPAYRGRLTGSELDALARFVLQAQTGPRQLEQTR